MPLVVLEGIDGCGKTTQGERLTRRLDAAGVPHRRLREPGGTALGEAVRRMLLDPATRAGSVAELFGYQMARAQLCQDVLAPALAAGELVVLDRFWPSTIAYQAYGLGLDVAQVRAAISLAVGPVTIDLALWFDVTPEEAERRRAGTGRDRIEQRGLDYQRRVRAGYQAMAAAGEITRVDAAADPDQIEAAVWAAVQALRARPA
jgi:dTMP kinase